MTQHTTPTGRSRGEPNLQNIPIRTEMGREIRKAFIVEHQPLVLLDIVDTETNLMDRLGLTVADPFYVETQVQRRRKRGVVEDDDLDDEEEEEDDADEVDDEEFDDDDDDLEDDDGLEDFEDDDDDDDDIFYDDDED